MFDVEIHMPNEAGQLALFGEVVGAAGLSVEGGGVWAVGDRGVAHFLFEDGPTAQAVLEDAGFDVVAYREVVTLRLRQDEPGQLGKLGRAMADAGVNIDVQYSDHDHQLVLVVDDREAAQLVADRWTAGS